VKYYQTWVKYYQTGGFKPRSGDAAFGRLGEKARKNSYATSGMLRKNKNNIGLLENPIKIIRAYFFSADH
jgi:hypothetical protein